MPRPPPGALAAAAATPGLTRAPETAKLAPMPREMCYRCWRPLACCLCPGQPPLETATRIVLLMHPKEYRHQKCTTGRLTCLNLARSEIIQGIDFDHHTRVRALVDDPGNFPILLYPGSGTVRDGTVVSTRVLEGRRLVVFLVDATWHCSRTIIRRSPSLLRLPRLSLDPRAPSRYTIKRQPAPWCLSTLEATHELLLDLEEAGLETYADKERLLSAFARMQDYQVMQTARAAALPSHQVRGRRERLPATVL